MQYNKILGLALAPTILFFLLSLVSVALTTHYWILGDWIIPRGVKVLFPDFSERTNGYRTDFTIIWFQDKETDATIASGCLNLSAAVMALIAWSTLRQPGMDTQFAAGKRRFWVLSVVVMTIAGAAAALASLVLHFTEQGSDDYGCTPQTAMMGGSVNTNLYCTREMAACNFLPPLVTGKDKDNTTVACNETVAVKWLQLILIINALVVLVMFSVQARLRRTTRNSKPLEPVAKSY